MPVNIDLTALGQYKELMGEDAQEFIQDLLETFFQEAETLEQNLVQSLEEQDAVTFNRLAHSLKSNLKTMGAIDSAKLFQTLESQSAAGNLSTIPPQMQNARQELARVIETLKEIYF